MSDRIRRRRTSGFTMLELLLTLTAVSVLAAVALPVVTQQLSKAHAARLVADLSALETALTAFHLDVRSGYPGQLDQLTNRPTPEEVLVDGRSYTMQDAERWNGPYLDAPIDDLLGDLEVATRTGTEQGIVNGLGCYDPELSADTGNLCGGGSTFVAVRVAGLDPAEFQTVSELLDGEARETSGKLRYDPATGIAYFLAIPYID